MTPSTEAWPGDRAARWVAVADRVERQLVPATELLLAAAERLKTTAAERLERVEAAWSAGDSLIDR